MHYRIGEFSKLAKLPIKTIRYYDEIGLLKPTRVDSFTNYRHYETRQLTDLQKIIALRQAGVSIPDTKAILAGGDTIQLLKKTRNELAASAHQLTTSIAHLDQLINNKGELNMEYQATTKQVPEYTVFYAQSTVKNYAALAPFIVALGEELATTNPALKCIKPDYCYVSYLDKEHRETDIKVEYAQAVEKAGTPTPTPTIKFKTIPATKVISIYHKGPWSTLGKAYAFAMDYLKQHHLQPTANFREVYIDGIWNKENETDYLTEIQIPIK